MPLCDTQDNTHPGMYFLAGFLQYKGPQTTKTTVLDASLGTWTLLLCAEKNSSEISSEGVRYFACCTVGIWPIPCGVHREEYQVGRSIRL